MYFTVSRSFKSRTSEAFMKILDVCNPEFRGKGVAKWEGYRELSNKSGDLLVILIVDMDYQSCINNAGVRLSLGIRKVGIKFV